MRLSYALKMTRIGHAYCFESMLVKSINSCLKSTSKRTTNALNQCLLS